MAPSESCYNCVYSYWDRQQAMWTMSVGVPARPMCGNQPDFPGRMKECTLGRVCRNFRARPPTPQGETVKTIPLGDGFYAYVDAADFEWLSRWNWRCRGGYAVRRSKRTTIYMHREIMKPPEGMVVDHRNRNKLDNTRGNLRVCTNQENQHNSGKRQGTSSRFKGVGYRRNEDKWYARLDWRGEPFFLGLFTEEIEAARARDHKAVELSGELAWVNLPEEWPPPRRREVHARWQETEGEGKSKKAKGKKGKVKGGRPKAKGARRKAKGARRKVRSRS